MPSVNRGGSSIDPKLVSGTDNRLPEVHYFSSFMARC